ncbi:FBLN7 protein, partial [Polyodon spathula]|nr:FBLN7 protein [Polyodon spathula]
MLCFFSPQTCPKLEVPNNNRKLWSMSAVGHEVHFLCEKGFELVGSETRDCQESHSWSGQQPFSRNINECAKSPCLNESTCVDDVNRFAFICVKGWSGTYCQNSMYSYWTSQTISYFSRQPHCADMQGSTQRTCDEGFQIAGRDNSLCQDLDECELYYLGRLPRLCSHTYVSTLRSYRCTYPPGYTLHDDQRNCKDEDECASRQHNCSRDELCVNTSGGFQCMQPDCPRARQNTSYVKTCLLRCERNPCPVDNKACIQAASSISFSYLSLVSNLTVPHMRFRVSAASLNGDSLRFGLLGGTWPQSLHCAALGPAYQGAGPGPPCPGACCAGGRA